MIKEVIVVEGRDDLIAVKAAVDCEVIKTNGYGYGGKLISLLRELQEKQGLIILTDPDPVGERIRRDLSEKIPGVKHAFIEQRNARKKGDIGIENASAEEIRQALERARATNVEKETRFTTEELSALGLMGGAHASVRRNLLSELLKIGHCNGKQLEKRLNHFGVTRDEFDAAMKEVEARDGE